MVGDMLMLKPASLAVDVIQFVQRWAGGICRRGLRLLAPYTTCGQLLVLTGGAVVFPVLL